MDDETPYGAPVKAPKKRHFIKRHRKLIIILSIVLVLLIGGGVTAWMVLKPKPAAPVVKTSVKKASPAPKIVYYSPLTGLPVATKADETAPVTGVMIENSPDARPQSGLKDSGVVFEAIAEGGITRFLAIYQAEKPQLIGPVRSVRIYDLDILQPFDASIAHVGGSAAALTEVRDGSWRDLDQFFNGNHYWRTSDRAAPHNVYTSFDELDKLNAAKGYTSSNFTGFLRKDSVAAKIPNATSIAVTISSALYNSSYAYNTATNTYDRSQAGAPHLDREDGQISPRVVIVMKVPEQTVLQDGYREQITTTGSGQAYIFQDGTETDATWQRSTTADQMSFVDANGAPIALARGQTWITAVPDDGGGVTWQ